MKDGIIWAGSLIVVIATTVAYAFTTFETKHDAEMAQVSFSGDIKEIKDTVKELYLFELGKKK